MNNINKLGNKFSLAVIALMFGVLMFAGNLFADVNFTPLSVYDSNNHYDNPTKDNADATGAIKRGTTVPLLMMEVTGAGNSSVTSLRVAVDFIPQNPASNVVVEDVITQGEIYLYDNITKKGIRREAVGPIRPGGEIQLDFPLLRPAENDVYILTVNVASDAISGELEMAVFEIQGSGTLPPADVQNPIQPFVDKAQVDATAPAIINAEYDEGERILEIDFTDDDPSNGNLGANSRIKVISISDSKINYGVAFSKVVDNNTVSKLKIKDADNEVGLNGAKLIVFDNSGNPVVIKNGVAIADQNAYLKGRTADWLLTNINTNEVYIQLTLAQAVDMQSKNLNFDNQANVKLWVDSGTFKDHVFDNNIGTVEQNLVITKDATNPELAADKVIEFNYNTGMLELYCTESISQVNPDKLTVKSYQFKQDLDGDLFYAKQDAGKWYYVDIDGNFINEFGNTGAQTEIDTDEIVSNYMIDGDYPIDLPLVLEEAVTPQTLSNADVTISSTKVELNISTSQTNILKGDHPIVEIEKGALIDIGGNSIFGNQADGYVEAHEVYVTPPLLSNVDSWYDSDTDHKYDDVNGYQEEANSGYRCWLNLQFSQKIDRVEDPGSIKVTNDANQDYFYLTRSEYETIDEPDPPKVADPRIVRFRLSKTNTRTIREWQRNVDIKEIHIELDRAGVVLDRKGNFSPESEEEMIIWDQDGIGPVVLRSSKYSYNTKYLELLFDEYIKLETTMAKEAVLPDDNHTTPDTYLVDPSEITVSLASNPTESFSLTKGEFLSDQVDNRWVRFQLSQNHADEIASWQAIVKQSGAEYELKVEVGINAVKDLNNNSKGSNAVTSNWDKDESKPFFVKPANYSPVTNVLFLRFTETINTTNFDLSLIKVFQTEDKKFSLAGQTVAEKGDDYLKIKITNTDIDKAIKTGNPKIDIEFNAITDLAGNSVYPEFDENIVHDSTGPELAATGHSYLHKDGKLILKFDEDVDVSETELDEIELEGVGSVILSDTKADIKTTTDGKTIEIKITDGDIKAQISSWGRTLDILTVKIDEGAVQDLSGNENVTDTATISSLWTKDIVKPTFSAGNSKYYHDIVYADGRHYSLLVLAFSESMNSATSGIDTDTIVLARESCDDADRIVLTEAEIAGSQYYEYYNERFGNTPNIIICHLNEAHRNQITRWGAPNEINTHLDADGNKVVDEDYGDGKDKFRVFFDNGSVEDIGGNDIAATNGWIDDWRKDTHLDDEDAPAKVTSVSYDGNSKKMKVTFDSLMDASPATNFHVDLGGGAYSDDDNSEYQILDKDKANPVNIIGSVAGNNETKTIEITLNYDTHEAVNGLASPLYLKIIGDEPQTTTANDSDAAHKISGEGCQRIDAKNIDLVKDTQPPSLVSNPDDGAKSNYEVKDGVGILTLDFDENIDKPASLRLTEAEALASNVKILPSADAEGITLTGNEIKVCENFILCKSGDAHEFKFYLTSEHKSAVDTWSAIYVKIAAGAFKDTAGNLINAVSATKIKGLANPVPVIHVPSEEHTTGLVTKTAPAGVKLTIQASVTDNTKVDEVRLYHQVGGSTPIYQVMSKVDGTDSIYSADIPAEDVSNRGLSYYIWAEDEQGATTTNMMYWHADGKWVKLGDRLGPQNVTVEGATVTLTAGTLPVFTNAIPSEYRMISVPIETDTDPDVDNTITSTELFAPFGEPNVGWNAWKYTGRSDTSGYQPGHIEPFEFGPGDAAWIGTENPDNALTVTGNTVNVVNKARITLQRGWNQIGNPYNFSRSWNSTTIFVWTKAWDADGGNDIDEVELRDINEAYEARKVSNEIYWFTGETSEFSFASADPKVPGQSVSNTSWTGSGIPSNDLVWQNWPGTLDPWGACWVYAYEDSTLLIDPTAPTKGVVPPTPSAPSEQVLSSWSVKFLAESAGNVDTVKSAGVVTVPVEDVDRYDVMDLPAIPGSNLRLSFITEEGSYLQDMKTPADEMIWKLQATSVNEALVKINFDASSVPSEYLTVLLVDTETEERVNLRSVSSYSYKDDIREFKLIVSRAHPEVYAAIPDRTELLQNYPNPFNPETWIPFQLSDAGEVNIRIYNLSGELVRKLELGRREAGSYTARERAAYWDGRNQFGERVASGVYFYHIQTSDFNATKRMVILK
jgi:hypothetical protein